MKKVNGKDEDSDNEYDNDFERDEDKTNLDLRINIINNKDKKIS